MKKVYLILVLLIIVISGFSQKKGKFTYEPYNEASIWSDTVILINVYPPDETYFSISFSENLKSNSTAWIVQGKFDFSCELDFNYSGKDPNPPGTSCDYIFDRFEWHFLDFSTPSYHSPPPDCPAPGSVLEYKTSPPPVEDATIDNLTTDTSDINKVTEGDRIRFNFSTPAYVSSFKLQKMVDTSWITINEYAGNNFEYIVDAYDDITLNNNESKMIKFQVKSKVSDDPKIGESITWYGDDKYENFNLTVYPGVHNLDEIPDHKIFCYNDVARVFEIPELETDWDVIDSVSIIVDSLPSQAQGIVCQTFLNRYDTASVELAQDREYLFIFQTFKNNAPLGLQFHTVNVSTRPDPAGELNGPYVVQTLPGTGDINAVLDNEVGSDFQAWKYGGESVHVPDTHNVLIMYDDANPSCFTNKDVNFITRYPEFNFDLTYEEGETYHDAPEITVKRSDIDVTYDGSFNFSDIDVEWRVNDGQWHNAGDIVSYDAYVPNMANNVGIDVKLSYLQSESYTQSATKTIPAYSGINFEVEVTKPVTGCDEAYSGEIRISDYYNIWGNTSVKIWHEGQMIDEKIIEQPQNVNDPINPLTFWNLPAGNLKITCTYDSSYVEKNITMPTDPGNLSTKNIHLESINVTGCAYSTNGSIIANLLKASEASEYELSIDGEDWYDGTFHQFDELGQGSYTVYARADELEACVFSKEVTVSGPDSIKLNLPGITDPECPGSNTGAIQLSLNNPLYKYHNFHLLTSSGKPLQSGFIQNTFYAFNNLPAGSYQYFVENENGCFSDTVQVTLSDPETLEVIDTSTVNVACHGGSSGKYSFDVSGPYDTLFFKLNGKDTLLLKPYEIAGLKAGSHELNITNELGCSITDTFTINEPDPLQLEFEHDTFNGYGIRCTGDASQVTAIVSGGTPNYTIDYNEFSVSNDSITNTLSAGIHHYTVTDVNDCVLEDSLIMDEPDSLILDVMNVINPTCSGSEDGSIEVLGSGGVPGYKLFVDTDSILIDNAYTISNLGATIYPLALKDANGCRFPADGSDEIVQLENPNPIALEISQIKDPTCHGYTDGFIEYTAAHDTLTEKILTIYKDSLNGTVLQTDYFHDEPLNNTLNDIPAGDYVIEVVETATGCNTSTAITVDQPDELTYTLNHTDITCFGDTDGIISLNVEGGTPGYSAWYNGAGQDSIGFNSNTAGFSSLVPGDYTVSVTDINNCPATAINGDSVSIASPEMPLNLNLAYAQPTCNGDSDGTISANASGGWNMYAYSMDSTSWINNDSTHIFNDLQAGSHPVYLRDTQNCVVLDSIEVTEPDSLLADDVVITDANCPGSTDGNFEVLPTGGNGNYKLLYQTDTMPSMVVDSLSEGIYAYHLEDAKGCVFVDSVQVNDPPDFAHQFTLSDHNGYAIRCSGLTDSVLVEISGGSPGYVLGISGDGNIQSVGEHQFMISNLSAGTYQAELSDEHGCRYDAEVTLNEPDPLQINNISILEPSCHNYADGSYTGRITGGIDWDESDQYTVSFHGDSTIIKQIENDFQFDSLAAGNYELVAVDLNNCQTSRQHIIEQPEPMTLEFSTSPVVCKGGSSGTANVNPAGGTQAYTYEWFGPTNQLIASTKEITNLNAGTYTVKVTDSHGCTPHDSVLSAISVEEPDFSLALDTTEITPVRCFGESNGDVELSASGGWSGYEFARENFMWTTLKDFTNLEAGTYRFYVRDSLNCLDSTNVFIPQPDSLQIINIATVQPLCNGGSNGSVEVHVEGGNGDYLFTMGGKNVTSGLFDSISSGDYFLQVEDVKGCSVSDSVWVDEPTAISHELVSLVRPTCTQNNGSVAIAASGGTGNIAVNWSNDSLPATFAIDSLFAGTYEFNLFDENLCTYTSQVTLSDIGGPEVSMQNMTIPSCNYSADGSMSVNISGDAPPFDVNWYDANNQMIDGFDEIEDLTGGTYTVAVSDTNGCQYNDSYVINPPEPVQSQVFASDVVCYGESSGKLNVDVSGGTPPYNLSWRSAGENWQSIQQNDTIMLSAGSYDLKVFDTNNCHDENTDSTGVLSPVIISQPVAPLHATASPIPTKCYAGNDGMVYLNALGGWNNSGYLFALNNNSFSFQNQYTNLSPGTYSAKAKDIKGCVDSLEFEIGQPGPLEAGIDDFAHLQCKNDSSGWLQLSASGGTSPYYFSLNNQEQYASQTFYDQMAAGDVAIFTKDKNNCEDSTVFTLNEPDSLKFASFDALPSYCDMENGTINLAMEGGTAPYFLPDSAMSFADSLQLNNLPVGQLNIQIIDDHDCFIEKEIELEYVPGTAVELTNIINPLCYGEQSGSISLSASQGTPPYLVTVNGETAPGMELQSLVADNYSIFVADQHDCVDTLEVELTEPDSLFLNVVNASDPVCFNDSTGYIETQPAGGTAPYSVAWKNGETGNALELLSAGDYDYHIIDAHNCIDSGSVVLQNPDPLVTVLPDTLHLCANQTKTLDAVYSDHTYMWFKNNELVSQERELSIETPGIYSLELYSPDGCFANDSTEVIAYSYEADATLLMPTSARVNDTLIMIDISWPMPDSLNWLVPSSFNLLEAYDYEIHTQTTEEGGFMTGLITYTGNCIAEHYKSVNVEGFNNGNGGLKNGKRLFKSVKLSPNPAIEDALLLIDLFDPYSTKVELIDNQGEVVIQKQFGKAETHQWSLKLKSLERGMYFLRIHAEQEYRFVKLIVI